MKTFKRTISCFLALLMIFGSFSVLSYAALDDGNENTFQVYSKFFVDGVATDTVKVGDTVKVRVYLKNDYLMSTTCIMFEYPTAFMKFVVEDDFVLESSTDTGDSYNVAQVLNTSASSSAVLGSLSGYFLHQEGFVLDSMSPADNLVYDGFVTEDYWDDKGWLALTIDGGKPVNATAANDDDYLAEFTFTVKDTATADSAGYFTVIEDSELTPDNIYGFTCCERSQPGSFFNTLGSDLATTRDYNLDTSKDTFTISLGSGEVTPTTYAVSYAYKGEVPKGYEPEDATAAEEGDIISAPEVTVPAGYELTWTVTGATANEDGTYTVGTSAVAFLGTWAKKINALTYTFAGDAPAEAVKPADGTTKIDAIIPAPIVTIPDGYTLTWSVTGATKNDDGSYTAGAKDVAFVGTWAKIENALTYTFEGEGPANAAELKPADGTTKIDAIIPAPIVTVPDGYTLTWAVEGATKNEDGSYTAGAKDVAFVGTWAKVENALTYTFAGEGPANAAELKPADGTTKIDAIIPAPIVAVPDGYTLTWAVEGATKNEDGSYTAGAGKVAFVGTWAKVENALTYTFAGEGPANAAELKPADGTTKIDAIIPAPSTAAPDGYTLTWAVEGATKNEDGSYTAGAGDVAFVGTWAKVEYDVTYTFAGDVPAEPIEPAAHKTTVGATIAAPVVEIPDGYTVKWTATGATKNEDGSFIAGANDVEFVGTWAKKSYTITYYLTEQDKADGKVYTTKSVKFEDALPLVTPEVDGFTFNNWDYENEAGEIDDYATMPAYNLVAVASLTEIIYTVTFTDVWGDEVIVEKAYGKNLTAADIPDLTEDGTVNVVMTYNDDPLAKQLPLALEDNIIIDCAYNVTATFYEVYDEENAENNVVWKTYTFDFEYETTEEDFEKLGAPEKLGHSLDTDLPWTWEYIGQTMGENTYFVANWVANEYTATFTAGEGAFAEGVDTTVDVTFGETFTFDAKPVLAGYTCVGWTDVEGGAALKELVMDAEGKTFYPVFVENGKANYTVEFYLMDEEGNYAETTEDKTTGSATIGTEVTVAHADYEQAEWFSADEAAANKYTAVVAEDGSTVLKLYYKRAQYDVVIDGAEAVKVFHGATVKAPETSTATPDGYTLESWNDGAYEKGEVITVTGPLTLAPKFAAGTSSYTINTYTMGLDGKYGDADVTTGTYTTDETFTYTAPEVTGFTPDKESYSVKVTGDGKAEINVYYVRDKYDVIIDGVATQVFYEAEITAPETSANTPAGYVLESWNDGAIAKGAKITVTGPLTLAPKFAAGTSEYTINTYTMGLDGEYGEAKSETKTHTTDETVTYTAPVVEGFKADKESYSVKVTGDGKAEINVYYAREQFDVVINGVSSKVYYGATIKAPTEAANAPAGYHLASWNNGAVALGQEIEVTGPVTLEPKFEANTDTAYTVEIYLMDEYGKYAETPDDTDELTGTTDTPAEAAHATYPQEAWFTPAAAGNVTSVTITGDGKATLKLYFERAQYDVTIDGVVTPVYHGATINAPTATTQAAPAGFSFAGWNNGTIAAGAPITVTEAMALVPYFAENENTPYTVEIYLQNADGTYNAVASKTEDETGKTGEEVTISHADYAQEAYYLADDAQANEFTGTIAGDGSLVLKLYFKRAMYTVAYEYEDGTAIGEAAKVRYGAAIEAPAYDTPDGMNFIGWFDKETNEKMPAEMPAKNATYVVKFAAGDAIPYTIAIYMMDVNGEYVVTESELSGTTGTPVSVTPNYSYTGFKVNTEKSNLNDVIAGNGSTVLSVYYDRNLYKATFDGVEYQVYYGASLPTVEPEAQTGKEFVAWTPAVPASMPAEDLEFTSTWTEAVYKLIYIINGAEEEYEYAAGATVTPIADPVVPGMTFKKWNKTIPTEMPAEDVIIVAEFEAAVFKATFVDADGNVFDEKAVKYGDTIVLPASNPTKEYHVFKGWLDVPETMPATNVTITPIFEKVPVRLVAVEGSTTIIDRETGIITGLTTRMNDTIAAQYLAVEGDGYYTITAVGSYSRYGTGAKVEVFDRDDTSAPVETFYIVIYGDINGDADINAADGSLVENEVLYVTSWSRGSGKDALKVKAADLVKDGYIQTNDADSIINTTLGIASIDQATGTVVR